MFTNDVFGFAIMNEKKDKLLPILSQYEFQSVAVATFSITSWRNNRGAQESCLALNKAISELSEFGTKRITSNDDLVALFDLISPALEISSFDDPVIKDFGEIKLCFNSRYCSVITGTGHTVPVFAALQYLEPASKVMKMDTLAQEILEYSNCLIRALEGTNAPIDLDNTFLPQVECPSFDYFQSVASFFSLSPWNSLNPDILSMLSSHSNEIVRSHFFYRGQNYYPLFNPSIVIDFFTKVIEKMPQQKYGQLIRYTIGKKITRIFGKSQRTTQNGLLLNGLQPLVDNRLFLVNHVGNDLIVFLNYANDDGAIMSEIQNVAANGNLSIGDIDARVAPNKCRAYHINKNTSLRELLAEKSSLRCTI